MTIAAMRIPQGGLPDIFGKDHGSLMINFGGKNIYTFENETEFSEKPNEFYLEDLFTKNMSLFSCIVGSNGAGKTTILRVILASHNCDFIIENDDGESKLVSNLENFHRIYYTPYLHSRIEDAVGNNGKDLSKAALLKMDNHDSSNDLDDFLDAHHSENSKRWIKFNKFYRNKQPAKISLPTFDRIEISLKHFERTISTKGFEFNDTSTQLRPALRLLFKKIETEEITAERQHFRQKGKVDDSDRSYFKVRFEYAMYETMVGKLISILERRGNKYLEEGFIADDYETQMGSLNVKSAIEWFLQNSGVRQGDKRYSFSQHLILLDLIDFVKSLITQENISYDNWRKIIVTEDEALKLIELYDTFTNSFINDWFEYDGKPAFEFTPSIKVSSGEQHFLNLFSVLYSHAENIRAGVDIDVHSHNSLGHIKNDILLLLDEGDNAFHPQWKKEYVKNLRTYLPIIFEGFNLQIIITSHDPLTLSDIPKNSIVFLEKGAFGTVIGDSATKHTFGANLSDLLKDSFFLNDGQIGDFVADKIDETIQEIRNGDIKPERRRTLERVIKTIDEPIIKFKLAEMLRDAIGDTEFERELLDNEIKRLQEIRRSI